MRHVFVNFLAQRLLVGKNSWFFDNLIICPLKSGTRSFILLYATHLQSTLNKYLLNSLMKAKLWGTFYFVTQNSSFKRVKRWELKTKALTGNLGIMNVVCQARIHRKILKTAICFSFPTAALRIPRSDWKQRRIQSEKQSLAQRLLLF